MSLTEMQRSSVPEEVKEFEAVECFECEYEGYIEQKYFLSNEDFSDDDSHQRVENELSKLGYSRFTAMNTAEGDVLLSVCKCPKCGSEDIMIDYY